MLAPWLPGSPVAKQVRPLLDQQFFCWGEDIKAAQGNLLVHFGFTRVRADESRAGCSRYHLRRADGDDVVLWGGGFLLRGTDGWGIVFARAPFRPRLVAPTFDLADAWSVADVPTLGLPQMADDAARLQALLARSFGFCADYEAWVTSGAGPAWREEIVARWWKPRTPAVDIARKWRELAWAMSP